MHTAIVQTNPIFGEVKKNVREALLLMETTKADLYILPELFNTGYNFIDEAEVKTFAEPADGLTFRTMNEWAKKNSCYIVYGFAEKADKILASLKTQKISANFANSLRALRLYSSKIMFFEMPIYNSAALVGPDGMVGLYRKVHLFDRENLFFTPGNLGFPVFDLPFGKVGMMICFDWIYPESARSLALKGAQLIAHPANLVLPFCPDAMVTRCLENKVFAATADRVGEENRGGVNLKFIGTSGIVAPNGSILCRLGTNEASIAVAEIDLSLANNKKINLHNNLFEGRRTDQYSL